MRKKTLLTEAIRSTAAHPPVFRTLVIAEAMCSASAASRLKSQTCRRNVTSAGCGGAGVGPGAVDVAAPAPSSADAGPRFKPHMVVVSGRVERG